MKHYFYQTRLIIILFDIWIEFIRLWDSVKSFQVFELILLGSIARRFSTIQHIISDSAAQKFSIFYSNFIRICCMEIRTYSNRLYQIWLVGNVHSKCSSNFGDSSFYKTTKYSKRFKHIRLVKNILTRHLLIKYSKFFMLENIATFKFIQIYLLRNS